MRPLCRRRCPRTFEPAGDCVPSVTGAELILPAESLLLNSSRLWLAPNVAARSRTVALAKGVSTSNQCHGFFVVHRHPAKRLANVFGRCQWIAVGVWTFRVDVNQSHLHRTQRFLKIAIARVTFVAQPLCFRSPENIVLRLPNISAASSESERFKSHGLQRTISREDHQIRPRKFVSILLFDGPQQTTRFI